MLHGCRGEAVSPAEQLLVLAGAGTGKTETLAAFAAYRLGLGIDPNRILILAFNSAAARQIGLRVRAMAAGANRNLGFSQWGTFHAIGLRFIRQYASRLGLVQSFTVQDRADSERLMEAVLAQSGGSTEKGFPDVEACLRIYSLKANTLGSLQAVLTDRYSEHARFQRTLAAAFESYDQAKRTNNVVDFDDLLTFWYRLLKDKEIGRRISNLFDYVLVDEYQDITLLQDRILQRLRSDGRGLVLVGDDDQCIYWFRGVTPRHIRDRATRANVLKLTQSHRSTQPVLDASNTVISQSVGRADKALWSKDKAGPKPRVTTVRSERDQALHVIEQVTRARVHGLPLREQAVLARTAKETSQLEAELKRLKIPYRKIGGPDLFDRPDVKTVLAILSWCENPKDTVSGMRAMEVIAGLDPATALRIAAYVGDRLNRKQLMARRPPSAKRRLWADFVNLLDALKDLSWDRQIHAVCRWLREYRPEHALGPKMARRLGKLALQHQTRAEFLAASRLERAASPLNPLSSTDRLTISTIHSAKGQEWTAVYILNAVDGCIPFRLATCREEERRILFVGMTRAKRRLELLVPKRLGKVGNSSVGLSRTPFISKRMLNSFELSRIGARSKRSVP